MTLTNGAKEYTLGTCKCTNVEYKNAVLLEKLTLVRICPKCMKVEDSLK